MKSFTPTLCIPILLLILNLTITHSALTVRQSRSLSSASCSCPNVPFESQYKAADSVVRVVVVKQYVRCENKACRKKRNASAVRNANAIRVYQLYLHTRYKGPSPGDVFYAQAFENEAYCGVRLTTGRTYMLNLEDRSNISVASHWKKNMFVLRACQAHWNWEALNKAQLSYLSRRRQRQRS